MPAAASQALSQACNNTSTQHDSTKCYNVSKAGTATWPAGAEEEAGGKGLFGLPFMKRAAEQQKAAAAADAAVLLRSIESEVSIENLGSAPPGMWT